LASISAALSPHEALEALIARHKEGSVSADLRREAFARYESLPMPRPPQGRYWKRTYAKLEGTDIRSEAADRAHDVIGPKNVAVTAFHHARAQHPTLFERAFRQAFVSLDDPFAALAFAFQSSGRFIHVPPGVVVDEPITITYDASEQFPYTLVSLGEDAQATIIEEIGNERADAPAFICGISEVVLADRARLTYAALQQTGDGDRIFMTRRARCGADASMHWALAELGSALARTTLHSALDKPGASAEITALFFTDGNQHVDLAADVDHLVGPTRSQTLVKSAAVDHGQGRAFGNIYIRAGAHGVQASLRDDALLLSKDAHIDAIPALEIAANDVKAYHGATVGSIDEEELFYATSRGIPLDDAKRMIALGFFEPALERFPGNALRERIRATLAKKLG
jgi:Fe-S cluster assembly protein SufD